MIICLRAWNWERFFRLGTVGIIGVGILSLIVLGALVSQNREENIITTENKKSNFSYENIGSGALMLNPQRPVGTLPYLNDEIVLLARNGKPGKRGPEKVLIGLKSSQEERTVVEGEVTYLDGGVLFTFSDKVTPLWIKPVILDRESVLMQIGCKEQKTEFILKRAPKKKCEEFDFLTSLKEAQCWGKDLFVEQYGGQEYAKLKNRDIILFNNPPHACFVQEGDYLEWQDGFWKITTLDHISNEMPVAVLKSITGQKIEMEVWDATGFTSTQLKLERKVPSKMNLKQEEIFNAMRLRTSSQISCMMEKRRMILKKGDWLLRTVTGWHKLKNAQEIDDCLEHKISGELLIFNDVKKEKGKNYLIGHLFDATRTQMQNIMMPIADKNEKKHSLKKKEESKK